MGKSSSLQLSKDLHSECSWRGQWLTFRGTISQFSFKELTTCSTTTAVSPMAKVWVTYQLMPYHSSPPRIIVHHWLRQYDLVPHGFLSIHSVGPYLRWCPVFFSVYRITIPSKCKALYYIVNAKNNVSNIPKLFIFEQILSPYSNIPHTSVSPNLNSRWLLDDCIHVSVFKFS